MDIKYRNKLVEGVEISLSNIKELIKTNKCGIRIFKKPTSIVSDMLKVLEIERPEKIETLEYDVRDIPFSNDWEIVPEFSKEELRMILDIFNRHGEKHKNKDQMDLFIKIREMYWDKELGVK